MVRSNPDLYELQKQIKQALFQDRTPQRRGTSGSGTKSQQNRDPRSIDKEGLDQCEKGNKAKKFQKISTHIFKCYTETEVVL